MRISKVEIKKIMNLAYCKVDKNVVKNRGYDYFKIPVCVPIKSQTKSYKKLCLKGLYKLYSNLKIKYSTSKYVKIIVLVKSLDFCESQVIIFFNKQVYYSWFKRDSKYQKWIRNKKTNPLIKKLRLSEFEVFDETHYKEIIQDKELTPSKRVNDLWFYE